MKSPLLTITVCHHSASLKTPIGDHWDVFFLYSPHTHESLIDSYILHFSEIIMATSISCPIQWKCGQSSSHRDLREPKQIYGNQGGW